MRMLYFRLSNARAGYSVQGSYDEHKWMNLHFYGQDKESALKCLEELRRKGFTIC